MENPSKRVPAAYTIRPSKSSRSLYLPLPFCWLHSVTSIGQVCAGFRLRKLAESRFGKVRKTLRSSSAPRLSASGGASLLNQIQQARSTVKLEYPGVPGPDDKGRNVAEQVISSVIVADRLRILMPLR